MITVHINEIMKRAVPGDWETYIDSSWVERLDDWSIARLLISEKSFCLPERGLQADQQSGHHQKTTKSELLLSVTWLFLLQSSLSGPQSSSPAETNKSEGCDACSEWDKGWGICFVACFFLFVYLGGGSMLFWIDLWAATCLPLWLRLAWKQEAGAEMFFVSLEAASGMSVLWGKVSPSFGSTSLCSCVKGWYRRSGFCFRLIVFM